MSFIGFKSILKKEITRIIRIWPQTLIPPIITSSIYFIIFSKILFKDKLVYIDNQEFYYSQYIVVGLIAMAIIMNSYSSASSSFFSMKFQRNVEELLISPLSTWTIILGYIIGGMCRGIINGLMIFITSLYFEKININSYLMFCLVALLMSFFFATIGMINAIFSKKFDDITWFPSFILTPLVYLGGVFFTIDMLPKSWQVIAQINPIYNFINILRNSALGSNTIDYLSLLTLITFNIILFLLATYFFDIKLRNK